MEHLEEYIRITLKVFTILPIVVFLILKSGRRKIGELPIFDFISIIVLGSMIGADLADPKLKYLPTAYAIILVIFFQNLVAYFKIKSRKFGKLATFGPTIVIQNGNMLHENMRRLKYTTENILMLLREKDIFDLNEVEFAVIEDNGTLNVLKKSEYIPVTPKDLNLQTKYKGLSIPVVIDGEVHEGNLKKLGLTREWLSQQLKTIEIKTVKDVFYAEINSEGKIYISRIIKGSGLNGDFKIC